ncbi:hypothetical protein Syun_012776 [Stephania yunnanensis]|uniref:Uncharacterized protein n=1 Tax=Stephania yunnanensis TaxID=152371 RepID=A0AAP0K053_9MAGN
MSHPHVPQHEGNQQFHQSLSLEDMVMPMIYQMIESVQDCRRVCHNIQKLDFSCSGSKDLVTDLDQYIVSRQGKIDEAELCSTQPTFNPEEDVSVDTLTNLELKEDTQIEDYLIETSEECKVLQIEPEIVIALNEGEDKMNIDVNLDKPENLQIESEEDQLLVLVQPLTFPCTFGTSNKGVEVKERLQIFYTADTFVLDDLDTIDSFVSEVPDELLNLKEGMHASLPNYVDGSFIVDIPKGEGNILCLTFIGRDCHCINDGEDEMNIDVNSDKPEKPQIKSEENQPLVLVQPPTLSCTFGTPYKGVKVRKRLQIFYTADTFVLDDPDTIDSFVLEVPNEL